MWLAWLMLVLLQHQFPWNSWTCVALLQHQSKKSGTCWLQSESKRQHAMFVMLVLLQHHSRSKSNTRWSCYWRQQFCSTNSYEIPRHVVGAAHAKKAWCVPKFMFTSTCCGGLGRFGALTLWDALTLWRFETLWDALTRFDALRRFDASTRYSAARDLHIHQVKCRRSEPLWRFFACGALKLWRLETLWRFGAIWRFDASALFKDCACPPFPVQWDIAKWFRPPLRWLHPSKVWIAC